MSGVAKYRVTVRADDSSGERVTLPAPTAFTVSEDIDRRPYIMAELKFGSLTTSVRNALDPRLWPVVYISAFRDAAGLPNAGNGLYTTNRSTTYTLYVTRIVQEGDGWVLTLASGEVRMDAQLRLAPTAVSVASVGNVQEITDFLLDYIGAYAQWAGGTPGTVTGDAALWNPGESIAEIIDPILERWGLRVYAVSATEFGVAPIGEATGYGVISTLTINKETSLQGIRRTLAADAEYGWYNGVLIQYEYVNGAGVTVTSYDRWPPSGVHTRGLFLKRDRANPGSGAAKSIYARSTRRGLTYEVDMTLIPGVNAGWDVIITDPFTGVTYSDYKLKSIESDYMTGTMSVAIQPPTPEV